MFHKLTQKVINTVNTHHKDEDTKHDNHIATEKHSIETTPSLQKEAAPSLQKEVVLEAAPVVVLAAPSLQKEVVLEAAPAVVLAAPSLQKEVILEAAPAVIASTSTLSSESPICDGVSFSENTIIKEPIIQETVREDVFTEVQTVIHRDIQKKIVNHITQHVTVAPAPSLAGTIQHAPIIEEVVHTTEVDEIQPIVHRELAQQVVMHQEKHLSEHIVEPTLHTYDVVVEPLPQKITQAPVEIVEGKEAIVNTIVEPTIHEQHKKDAIIENKVRKDVLVEIQPIVHRDVDQKIVHHIDKHITEAPAPSLAGAVEMPAIVHDSFHRIDTNEIQPVVHRELAQQRVERKEIHLDEHIVDATVHSDAVVVEPSNFATPAPAALVIEDKQATLIETFAPVERQSVTKDAIIDEKIRQDILIETQPIIKRDIDQPVVHHIEKHITEAPAASLAGTLKKAPIIQEVVHVTEVDDITPVMHTETAERVIEKREEHVTESPMAWPTQYTVDTVSITEADNSNKLVNKKKMIDLDSKLASDLESDLDNKLKVEGRPVQ